jgi:murein DD-endopeptidase MepM/ murein hydrolase activator NlpD
MLLSLAALAVAYLYLGGFGRDPFAVANPGHLAEPSLETYAPEVSAIESTTAASSFEVETAVGSAESDVPLPEAEFLPHASWHTVTIERNESFYLALQRFDLSHETIMGIVRACEPHTNLKKVKKGDSFELALHESGSFAGLRFELDPESYLTVTAETDGTSAADVMDGARTDDAPAKVTFTAELAAYPTQRVVRGVRGTIQTNLFDALRDQGADPLLADQLAEILGWEIDFFRDLRVGDTFVAVYEEHVYEGRKVRDDRVLAVHFVNQGRQHEAYVFDNAFELPSYYDGEGNSLERQFLRAPLKFSRISSGFSKRRLHPVLKRYAPHYGVDFVAPTGTPVLATADGVVIKREYRRGNGNYVGLRHGQGYESYYLHFSRFAKGVKVGGRVKQGQVIGYVGSTGWSTGPHLDYRIKRNGRWMNPRKLKLPPAEPVSAERREEFLRERARLVHLIDSIPDDAKTVVMTEGATSTPAMSAGPSTTR